MRSTYSLFKESNSKLKKIIDMAVESTMLELGTRNSQDFENTSLLILSTEEILAEIEKE